MKLCLVLVVCMLAAVPATTALTSAEIKDVLEAITVKKVQDYVNNCDCLTFKSVDGGNMAEAWRGKTCTAGLPPTYEFECVRHAVGLPYRWKPTTTCTVAPGTSCGTNKVCYAYGINKKYCLFTPQHRGTFCPCQQL